ncbi:hypothetical protein Poli38472_001920 [Pythium oligandrum]|uniref:Protein kinase domain-containing protein n=1 Tax=Pythium oligandrum TaxID=41045 RepID=A0A8K1FQT5_PYTOL|nr:hypothetical protein Poli38472_001920 [Pythium oligandrum]|eukprot:TMW69764.1 hypothetical protein Poli38472_001920 [Pythium oligandrum]
MTRLPLALTAVVTTMASVTSAATCAKSGIVTPGAITLTVDPSLADSVALVVNAKCQEIQVEAKASEEVGELRVTANNMSIKVVESYPAVQSLFLQDNAITTFKADGTTLKEVDLTNNQIASLDDFKFPSSVQRLFLDFNPVESFSASNFPANLKELYFRKSSLSSVASYRFNDNLQKLFLNGNQNLLSLKGLVLPDNLQSLECSDCGIDEIVGVTFPDSLRKIVITGKTISSFDVRESDVPNLKKMQLQMDVATISSCSNENAQVTPITDSISACVMDDTSFAIAYPIKPKSVVTTAPVAGSTPSTTTPGAPVSGGSTTNNEASTGGGSNTNTITIIVGVLVLVAVLVGAAIGWFFQRRRRSRKDSMNGAIIEKGTGTETKTLYEGMDAYNSSSVNSGFLPNDVRNDSDLIPYRLPNDAIKIVAEIATGGFGIVYRATLYGQTVVVKQVTPIKANSPEILRRFMDEIRLYARLDHPKIVKFVGLSWTNLLDLSLVMEYMPRGDLNAVLKMNHRMSRGRSLFSWFNEQSEPRCKALLAQDVAEALVYLHSFASPIIHRDLKAKNVLLSENFDAKLSDFGISRESAEETMTGGMGTTAWIAPEVLQGDRYSEKADIYSFGILMCELDACGHPYDRNKTGVDSLSDAKIAYLVSTASLKPQLDEDCPPAIERLIMSCIEFDPSKRPTALELHYNLRKIREAALQSGFV